MANILDYLDWRGDLTLSERPFNEVDNLILAEICYLDFSGFAPASFAVQTVTLQDAANAYFAAHPTTDMGVLVPDQIPVLVERAAKTARFGDIRLLGYVNRIDAETQTQFSAMTMLLPDGSAYVAFRGTDDTIVGWKEDFNMAFTPEIPAQKYACAYLQQAAKALPFRPLLVGGHSKGGNLAVYAAVFCGQPVQKQLTAVYNNDGPGFYTSLLPLPAHRAVSDRITTILPESSVVGMLLAHEERYQVVRSTQIGLMQHDGFSWLVKGERFEHLTELAEGGRIMDQTLKILFAGAHRAPARAVCRHALCHSHVHRRKHAHRLKRRRAQDGLCNGQGPAIARQAHAKGPFRYAAAASQIRGAVGPRRAGRVEAAQQQAPRGCRRISGEPQPRLKNCL